MSGAGELANVWFTVVGQSPVVSQLWTLYCRFVEGYANEYSCEGELVACLRNNTPPNKADISCCIAMQAVMKPVTPALVERIMNVTHVSSMVAYTRVVLEVFSVVRTISY